MSYQCGSVNQMSPSGRLPWLLGVYGAIVICFIITFIWGALALTVEPDEVWNLMSTMKALGLPLPQSSALNHPVTTTGGLHFVVHGLIALAKAGDITLHRMVSIVMTIILLSVVFRVLENSVKDRVLAAAGTALFVLSPGFLLQASLATSEIIATTVFLVASVFWVRAGSRSVGMAIIGGGLFGLACATRMTCLSMLPAILVWSVLANRGWVGRLVYPLVAIGVAVLVFLGAVALYFYAFGETPWSEFLLATGLASGVGNSFPGVMLRLNYVVVADGIIPAFAVIALLGWYFIQLERSEALGEVTRLCGFLILAGGAGWFAWVLKAPIAHIRYLWPAIPMLWLAGIIFVIIALQRIARRRALLIAHLTIVVMCAYQGLLDVRMLAVGDSLSLIYEVTRRTDLGTPRAFFEARGNQDRMVELIENLPSHSKVYALTEPTAYPITYMSGRSVRSLSSALDSESIKYLLVLPSDYTIWRPKWDWVSWLDANGKLIERRGEYALYRLASGVQMPVR